MTQALRYVVSRHDGVTNPHFDLMFETAPGSMLATFRLPEWPISSSMEVIRLRDHRRLYLDYEGPISGDRGHVSKIAEGQCRIESVSGGGMNLIFSGGFACHLLPLGGERWQIVPLQEAAE
jgi:hypothetical protein